MTVAGEAAFPTLEGFDPLSEAFLQDPYPIIERARRECPVFYYPTLDAWFVTRYDDMTVTKAGSSLRRGSSGQTGKLQEPPPGKSEVLLMEGHVYRGPAASGPRELRVRC